MKEEALKLADLVDAKYAWIETKELSGMIRKLVAELDSKEQALKYQKEKFEKLIDAKAIIHYKSQTKPLTDEEAMDIWLHLAINYDSGSFATFFVREIEKRHGIK